MSSADDPSLVDDDRSDLPRSFLRQFQTSQLDFEVDFFAGVLARDPLFVEALRIMSQNLAAKGDRQGSLAADVRLSELRPRDSVVHYNLACGYSRLGRIESALSALERTLELGYAEVHYLREDRDLDAVRKDPRFRELLAARGLA